MNGGGKIDFGFRFHPFTGYTTQKLKSGHPLFGYNVSE
jgi:hypothetical protein